MIGTFYYPEQWPEEDWEGDFKKIASMGLGHVHMAEFAWAHLEPDDGRFSFDWLDRAIELARSNGLRVILCTPTACPPVWLSQAHPEIRMVRADGRPAGHGSRSHRCVNSDVFNSYAERISAQMAKRYRAHEEIIGWQLDNEIGHYKDAPCFCPFCEKKFRAYLREKYDNDIGTLNKSWAGDFWSQNYTDFTQIRPPNRGELCYFPNEHSQLDFLTFFSKSQTNFLEKQASILRQHIDPRMWITHNFVTNEHSVDPGHLRGGLDLFTITHYPVAGVFRDTPESERYRIGDPVEAAFHHDFTRRHNGRWGVMEQQPGQVNWGPYNCRPYPGSTRLWLWTAIAHGAELLDTYRFRPPSGGSEQYHDGLLKRDGKTISQGGEDFAKVASELSRLAGLWEGGGFPGMRRAAIVYDWRSLTALRLHPQSDAFDPDKCWRRFYAPLKRLGFQVDVVDASPDRDLRDYEAVVVALADLVCDETVENWRRYAANGGHLVVSLRVATRTLSGHFPKSTYGGRIEGILGASNLGYDVLPDGHFGKIRSVSTGEEFSWNIWAEQWEPGPEAKILAVFSDQFYAGQVAAFRTSVDAGTATMVGFDAPGATEAAVMESLTEILPDLEPLPENCLYHRRGKLGIFLNYNDRPVNLPVRLTEGQSPLLGDTFVGPADLAVWRTDEREDSR